MVIKGKILILQKPNVITAKRKDTLLEIFLSLEKDKGKFHATTAKEEESHRTKTRGASSD